MTTHHDPGDEDRSADLYCENCGDPCPSLDDKDWNGRYPKPPWKPCPNPSPGRPLVDCGIGGHMYNASKPTTS